MAVKNETWNEIDSVVDQVLALSVDLKTSLNGAYDENNLRDALVTLLVLELGLYEKLATIFKTRSTSKIVEFASIARLLLESHATICWILDSHGNEQARGGRFMETGWDLQKHYNNLISKGYGLAKRTRSRLPNTETRMKTMNIPELANWYDELNFYIHPSAAIITQDSVGGLPKVIDFGVWVVSNVYVDSVLKVADELHLKANVKDRAKAIHELDIPEHEDQDMEGEKSTP